MAIMAAVLAGGRSSRMGRDKALIQLEASGPTMLELVLERVAAVADQQVIIATNRPQYSAFGIHVEPDHYPKAAALGGIATALEVADGSRCLVVPCDLPFLNVPLLEHLRERAQHADVVIPTVHGESRQHGGVIYQTLHAVYGPGCLPPVRDQLSRREHQIVRFFDQVQVLPVEESVVRGFDSELWSFFNVNTPEALAEAQAHLRDMKQGHSTLASGPDILHGTEEAE
jgi:molybdopterin-guanine dinucleotide biosynthesis protein A